MPSTPITSVTNPKTVQCADAAAARRSGVTTSKYASSTSSDSTMKPTITNQCAAPTTVHLSIRVWPSVSASIVLVRAPLSANRVRVGLAQPDDGHHPSAPRAPQATTATAVMAAARTVATIWTLPIALASPVCCLQRASLRSGYPVQ